MTLTKTVEIDIDIDQIIEDFKLNSNSKWNKIMLSVNDYVACFDDNIFYLIEYKDREAIALAIVEKLNIAELRENKKERQKMKVEHNDIIFTEKELTTLKEATNILINVGCHLNGDKDLAKGYRLKAGDIWNIVNLIDDVTWYAYTED